MQIILKQYAWEPKTKQDQSALLAKIDDARSLAIEAGVEGVNALGSSAINFWVFVRLCRTLRTEYERNEEKKMMDLRKELGFEEGEVEQFRHVFRSSITWQKYMAIEAKAADAADPAAKPVEKPKASSTEALNPQGLRRLI